MRKHIDIEADEADEPSEALVELFLSVQTWLTDYISTHVLQNYSELTVALQEAIRLYLKRRYTNICCCIIVFPVTLLSSLF